ncbi:conserved protein of unknown function [Burkholderia multivorans]
MPKIEVVKPFRLLADDGKHHEFPVGSHEVEQEVADHWYTKAHTRAPEGDDAEAAAKTEVVAKGKKEVDETAAAEKAAAEAKAKQAEAEKAAK